MFDTILRREFTEPEYAKYKVGQYLTEQSLVANPQSFINLRNSIELELRKSQNFKGDISIVEVYKVLGHRLACDPEQSMSFMQLEFNYDLEQIRAKDEMVHLLHLLHDLGREIWFITDIYYTQTQVEQMLRKIGVTVPYQLFVSSEMGLRKDSGTMWKFIKEKVTESNSSYIHVGDNVRSDAQICGDFGLANVHILHPIDKWQAAGFPAAFQCKESFDEVSTHKWGKLVSNLGRYPFFGE